MKMIESVFTLIAIVLVVLFLGWRANWNFKCMFDNSPQSCAVMTERLK